MKAVLFREINTLVISTDGKEMECREGMCHLSRIVLF